jgi:hypothetical protein
MRKVINKKNLTVEELIIALENKANQLEKLTRDEKNRETQLRLAFATMEFWEFMNEMGLEVKNDNNKNTNKLFKTIKPELDSSINIKKIKDENNNFKIKINDNLEVKFENESFIVYDVNNDGEEYFTTEEETINFIKDRIANPVEEITYRIIQ